MTLQNRLKETKSTGGFLFLDAVLCSTYRWSCWGDKNLPDRDKALHREPSAGEAMQTHIVEEELRTPNIALKYYRKMAHFRWWLWQIGALFPARISERDLIPSKWKRYQDLFVCTALRCFTSLLWDQCVGVNLGVMHRKLQTQMQVRWKSQLTEPPPPTQNWIQFPASCGRDGGGTELETHQFNFVSY